MTVRSAEAPNNLMHDTRTASMEERGLHHRPAYTVTLEGYQHAVERFRENPNPGTHHLWEMWLRTLEAQVEQTGKIELGAIDWSDGAEDVFERGMHHPLEFLVRHKNGDWGTLDDHHRQGNERAIRNRGQIVSSYNARTNDELWVITTLGWTATTILRPEEY